jgi:hypothetical protein
VNARRPVDVFAQTVTMLAAAADRQTRQEAARGTDLRNGSATPAQPYTTTVSRFAARVTPV